jgi:hypothetical protein
VLWAVLVAAITVGVVAQTIQGLLGNWGVGEDRLPPAWPAVGASAPGEAVRVLWLGTDDGRPFPPPGGDPEGAVAGGGRSVVYGVTGPAGRSVLATALPDGGPPYDRLERILSSVLSGRIRHGGALLAPMGIRFVVAGVGRLPRVAAEALAQQVDLDLVQRAGGLSIYRNARSLPEAAAIPGQPAVDAARSGSVLAPLAFDPGSATELSGNGGAWGGEVPESPSLVLVGDRFDPRWRAGGQAPFPAFGWALGFEATSGPIELRFDDGWRRPVELGILALLWLMALWFVRRNGNEEGGASSRPESMPKTPVEAAGSGP